MPKVAPKTLYWLTELVGKLLGVIRPGTVLGKAIITELGLGTSKLGLGTGTGTSGLGTILLVKISMNSEPFGYGLKYIISSE
jgi:uncharacterized spore protein YtfJ